MTIQIIRNQEGEIVSGNFCILGTGRSKPKMFCVTPPDVYPTWNMRILDPNANTEDFIENMKVTVNGELLPSFDLDNPYDFSYGAGIIDDGLIYFRYRDYVESITVCSDKEFEMFIEYK